VAGTGRVQPSGRATDPALGAGWSRVWGLLSGVVAPVTVVTSLLVYFGYVSARAFYGYFGVDVDTLGFATRDLVVRASQPLLVPLLGLLLIAALLAWVDVAARAWAGRAGPRAVRGALLAVGVAGGVLLAAGVVLVAAFPVLEDWVPYPLVAPLVLGAGAGVVERALSWRPGRSRRPRAERVLLLLVVLVCAFWATATVADWSGRGAAQARARDLRALPAVVVDTREPLFPGDDTVTEQPLPGAPDGYAFRYRGLRLLAEGDGNLFLVPEVWSESGSTFVMPLAEVRVKFRFVDDPP
jgi:hypothetical protein